MSFENFNEDPLHLEKNRIVEVLKTEGLTDETKEAVIKWTEQMEERAQNSSLEMIRFNSERADLYEAVGDIEEMFRCLDEALYQTEQEMNAGVENGNWEELLRTIKIKISEMEEKYP